MAVDSKTRQDIIDTLDELGAAVDTDIEQVSEIDDKVSLPGIRVDSNGNFVSYCLARMTVFQAYVKTKSDEIVAAFNSWFGTSDSTGVKGEWKNIKTDVNTVKTQAQEATSNANTATSNANNATSAANSAASNANEKAGLAQGIYNTVSTWFSGNSGFKATTESWLAARKSEWSDFFSDSLATGCRKMWTDFWNSSTSAWSGFFGSSAEDVNGVRKIWSNWFSGRQSEWNTLKGDAQSATSAANSAASNANEKAALANEKAGLANEKAGQANTAAAAANEKAALANEKAALANEKAGLAGTNAEYAKSQGDYAKQQGDRAKLMADHRDKLGTDGYIYRYDPDNAGAGADGYYKTDQYIDADIDPTNMTEQQINEMLSRFAFDFASTQTCETAASDPDSLTSQEQGKAVNVGGLAAALVMLKGLLKSPYFEGTTLVFPATSTMRYEGTTLILSE